MCQVHPHMHCVLSLCICVVVRRCMARLIIRSYYSVADKWSN